MIKDPGSLKLVSETIPLGNSLVQFSSVLENPKGERGGCSALPMWFGFYSSSGSLFLTPFQAKLGVFSAQEILV